MCRHVGKLDQPLVIIDRRVNRHLPASQFSDFPRLAGLGGEVGQSLEGGDISGLLRDGRLEGRPLGLLVTLPCREPGPRREQCGPGDVRGGQMGRGTPDLIGSADRFGPFEAGSPDGGVVGPRPLATVQPLVGLVQSSRTERQVGRSQPQQVIVGGGQPGPGQRRGDAIDRIGTALGNPQHAERPGRVGLLLGPRLKDGSILIAPARRPVKQLEKVPRFIGNVAIRQAGAEEAVFGEAIAAQPQCHPAARQRRGRGLRRTIGDAAPRGQGGVWMSELPLAVAQQELHLAVAGSALGQPG